MWLSKEAVCPFFFTNTIVYFNDVQGDIYNTMSPSISETTFLGDEIVRGMLCSLWSALEKDDSSMVLGLILGFDDLVLKWDKEYALKSGVPLDQAMASSDDDLHEGIDLVRDVLNKILSSMTVSPQNYLFLSTFK